MRCGWDEGKRRKNLALHGVNFTAVERFAWDFAVVSIDDREDYGELRQRAVGFIARRRTSWSSPSVRIGADP
jgi:uncharacterized DUF497 family protein